MNSIEGIFLISMGIYGFLLARVVLPRTPKNPEAWDRWRKRLGLIMKNLQPRNGSKWHCPTVQIF
ncbi:hypothetical protein OAG68_01760 [bacterium]|nr:hypothetical protein [bacterium]